MRYNAPTVGIGRKRTMSDRSYSMFPRGVYFKDGKAVGISPYAGEYDCVHTIFLPSDHYDFAGPVRVNGKTKEQIEQEAVWFECK
jgi:hypothetical protein